MKETKLLFAATITFFIAACTEQELTPNSLHHQRTENEHLIDELSLDSIYDNLDPETIVADNADVFGSDVLIFESEEEVDSLIERMSRLDYSELRILNIT